MRSKIIHAVMFLALLAATASMAASLVDLNTADASTLEKLGGIGPKKAKAIIEHRTQHGPFKSVDDLRKVQGIGAETFQSLKVQVTASQEGK